MNKKMIMVVLWAGFAVKAVYTFLMLVVILTQQLFKPFYSNAYNPLPFYFPVGTFLSALAAVVTILICCMVITVTLKNDSKSIVMEIVGMILFCGLLALIKGFTSVFTERIMYQLINYNAYSVAARGVVLNLIGMITPLTHIGTALFIFASGMSVAYKKSLGRI